MASIIIGCDLIVRPKGRKRKRKRKKSVERRASRRVKVSRKRSAPVQEGKTRAEHLFGDFDCDNSNETLAGGEITMSGL
jgi:hypothetical protein